MSRLLYSEPMIPIKAVSGLLDQVEVLVEALNTPQGHAFLKEVAPQVNIKMMAKKARSVAELKSMMEKKAQQQRKAELKAALDPDQARLRAMAMPPGGPLSN